MKLLLLFYGPQAQSYRLEDIRIKQENLT